MSGEHACAPLWRNHRLFLRLVTFGPLVGMLGCALSGAATAQTTNLISNPEELEKWTFVQGASVTANLAAAPNGSNTADQVNDTTSGSQPRIATSGGAADGGQYVFSVHLKAGTLSRATLRIRASGSIIASQEVAISGSWQRFHVATPSSTSSGAALTCEVYPGGNTGENGNVLAWGTQFEKGSTPAPYGGSAPNPDTTPPAAPTGLTAQATSGSAQLIWNANNEPDLARYQVWRATASGGPFNQIAETTSSNHTDSAVTGGSTYYYRLTAVDQTGNISQPSGTVSVTIPVSNPPPTPPTVPSGLAGNWDGTAVRLTWSANPETNITGYQVERRTGSGSGTNLIQSPEALESWNLVQGITVAPNSTAAPNGLQTGDRLDDGKNGQPRVQSNGVVSKGGAYVFSCYLKAGSLTQATLRLRANGSSLVTKAVSLSSSWQRYSVAASSTADGSELRAEIYPGGTSGGAGNIYAWGAQVETGTTPSSYGSGGESTFTQIGSPTSPSFSDANVSAGTTYEYRVRAVNSAGVSDPSNTVSVGVPSASTTITRGPYLQMASHSAITVRWRTAAPTNSRVSYGTVPGSLTTFTDSQTVTTEHEVRITNLQPDTRYYYAIGSTSQILGGNAPGYYFVTHPTPGTAKPTRIWVIGDAGTADAGQLAVRNAFYQFTGTRQTDLWLMLGDNAYNDGTDSEYQKAVFDIYGDLLRQSVVWPTRGNAERSTSPYYSIFTLPTQAEAGGLASGTERYYSFDYGNIHFICLDSEGSDRSPTGDMAQWVRADLANTTRTWVIAYWHHPPYSKGSHDSDSESQLVQMRTNIVPILEEGGVDLVLCGHSHSYERSFLLDGHYGTSGTLTAAMKIDGGSGRADTPDGAYSKATPGAAAHQGAVYAVAGSSGKTSAGSLDHPAMFISLKQLGSMVLDVNGNRLDAKFLRETGAVDDYFTILKGGG